MEEGLLQARKNQVLRRIGEYRYCNATPKGAAALFENYLRYLPSEDTVCKALYEECVLDTNYMLYYDLCAKYSDLLSIFANMVFQPLMNGDFCMAPIIVKVHMRTGISLYVSNCCLLFIRFSGSVAQTVIFFTHHIINVILPHLIERQVQFITSLRLLQACVFDDIDTGHYQIVPIPHRSIYVTVIGVSVGNRFYAGAGANLMYPRIADGFAMNEIRRVLETREDQFVVQPLCANTLPYPITFANHIFYRTNGLPIYCSTCYFVHENAIEYATAVHLLSMECAENVAKASLVNITLISAVNLFENVF